MSISKKEERIISLIKESALDRAPSYGIEPNNLRELLNEAISLALRKLDNDLEEFFSSLTVKAYMIESFQMERKKIGNHPLAKKYGLSQMFDYDEVFARVNEIFQKRITHIRRGFGEIYLWLERNESNSEEGVLQSFGTAHRDWAGRENMHNWLVVGNYGELQKAIDLMNENPENIKLLTDLVFGLQNQKGNSFDLYHEMKGVYTYSVEDGVRVAGEI